jgi:hypothetical protein
LYTNELELKISTLFNSKKISYLDFIFPKGASNWQVHHNETDNKTAKNFSVCIASFRKWRKLYPNELKPKN